MAGAVIVRGAGIVVQCARVLASRNSGGGHVVEVAEFFDHVGTRAGVGRTVEGHIHRACGGVDSHIAEALSVTGKMLRFIRDGRAVFRKGQHAQALVVEGKTTHDREQNAVLPLRDGRVVVPGHAIDCGTGRKRVDGFDHIVGHTKAVLAGGVAHPLHIGPAVVAARLNDVHLVVVALAVLRAVDEAIGAHRQALWVSMSHAVHVASWGGVV